MWRYWNPVQIIFGAGRFTDLPRLLRGRRYALVTYGEPFFGGLRGRLSELAGPPELVIADVVPNPDMLLLAEQCLRFRSLPEEPELIVALGGGSVIDSAKVFAAARGDFEAVRRHLEGRKDDEALRPLPIVAVPTTAGTGSEVTSWGTVWDGAAGVKHSLALPDLYPEYALIDPQLMLGKPRDLTLSTGLDALSHALESLWNKNANPVSMTFAVAAAREIMETLPQLCRDLGNLDLRTRMARAALLAGLAFSNTKTAIAHSLSYPITLRHGVAHGIACSFTLPMILRSVAHLNGPCEEGLRGIFGPDPASASAQLQDFLEKLDISRDPKTYGLSPIEWLDLVESAFEGERGQNFIGSRTDLLAAASDIVRGNAALPQ